MDIEQARELKDRASVVLVRMMCDGGLRAKLERIDARVLEYVRGVENYPDDHNMWEIVGVAKFLRMLGEYFFDYEMVGKIFRAIEGIWENNGKGWVWKSGGFVLESIRGKRVYRMTPMQCFWYAGTYGFKCYVDLGEWDGVTELLPSECLNPADGHVLDLRRVVTDVCLFVPRKTDKTGFAANCAVLDCLFGDVNSEGYCCANAISQSKILFGKVKDRLRQLDPKGRLFRMTAEQVNWKAGQYRSGSVTALSAGGRTKDGLMASLCLADEYGSAAYVKDKSDMAQLVQVVKSSMGPRRQPLTITTTTAGSVIQGPFEQYLDGVKEILEAEIEKSYT